MLSLATLNWILDFQDLDSSLTIFLSDSSKPEQDRVKLAVHDHSSLSLAALNWSLDLDLNSSLTVLLSDSSKPQENRIKLAIHDHSTLPQL